MKNSRELEAKQAACGVEEALALERKDSGRATREGERVMATFLMRNDSVQRYGKPQPMSPKAAAEFAVRVDAARTIAATKGKNLIYTIVLA